jgi:2-polyprenyl-6-methoxyphenol hydroxylase-like FAD-dependent oxidoreductase
MEKHYQVVIVGGGPVGAALAVDLGLRGITCAMIERRRGLPNIPKGQNLTQRTLEHFYFWGLIDEVRAARVMPPGHPIGEITAYDNLMGEYWYASAGREVVRPFYFQDNDRMPQYRMEAVLRKKMEELPGVDSYYGWKATSISQDDKGVRLEMVEDTGATGVLTGDYMVGCDGGNSLVREQVGISRGGTDFDQLMVLATFKSKELHERLKRFPERSTYRVMHPALKGYWQFFGRIDVGEGWFFHAPVPRAAAEAKDFDFHALVQESAGFKFNWEVEHVGFWDLRVSVADKYQVGRVFIAGDAAHTHPPYGGFGLNNGLEDVTNLGWKLAARLKGWGGDELLRSYSEERRPIFRDTAEDFIAARIEADGKFFDTYNPNVDKAAFEKAWEGRSNESGPRAMTYEPNFEGSSVIAGPPGGVCTAHGEHMYKARAGHHLTPQPLSSGRNVFEELGMDYALLAFGADDASVDALRQAARARGLPMKVIADTFEGGREKYEARLVLVRPDQYAVWTGDKAPTDADALMAKVAGQ